MPSNIWVVVDDGVPIFASKYRGLAEQSQSQAYTGKAPVRLALYQFAGWQDGFEDFEDEEPTARYQLSFDFGGNDASG